MWVEQDTEDHLKPKEMEAYTTLDGSVDRHGKPAIRATTGSWVAGIIVLGT